MINHLHHETDNIGVFVRLRKPDYPDKQHKK